jgi:hypothetical protein
MPVVGRAVLRCPAEESSAAWQDDRAGLAFAYSLWAIWGSGQEWLAKGFMLLLFGIPVYVWMKWRQSMLVVEAAPLSPEIAEPLIAEHMPARLDA